MRTKITLLFLLGFVGLSTAKAQIIVTGGININNLDIQYIELFGYNRSSYEASVWLDYGRNYDLSRGGEFLKPVNDNEKVRFKSLVDALNYFYKNDWELVQAYAAGVFQQSVLQHYVLRRKSPINK